MINTPDTAPNVDAAGLPVPFSKDDLRKDILQVFLLLTRSSYLLVDEGTAWPLAGPRRVESPGRLWAPDYTVEDLGLGYEMIRESHLALALEQQYDFGFLGLRTAGLEPMHDETMHTWIAALLVDLRGSQFVAEWDLWGVDVHGPVTRCLHACELANARLALEGDEPFSYFAGVDGQSKRGKRAQGESATSVHGLTIRQIALLSGMEEMTVRTAASRQGPNMLPTFKDEQRRTLVRPEDAKQWLKNKGRYVAIRSQRDTFDLSRFRPASVQAFNDLLTDRLRDVAPTEELRQDLRSRIHQAAQARGHQAADELTSEMLLDALLMQDISELLRVPPRLLPLRARQAVLQDDLQALEQQVREAWAESRAT